MLNGREKDYVNQCLDTGWISSKGSFVTQFESTFKNYHNSPFATTVCNGTVALHLALLALGIGPNDEVIVPSFTYIASVNAIKYVGATPVFVDIIESNWTLDASLVQNLITPRTKAVIAVHIYGSLCDMESLVHICDSHSLYLIEDSAEALGSTFKSSPAGTFGDISTFSFFGNKTLTTGEGGMLLCKDQRIYDKLVSLKSQSVSTSREYWHDEIGYNYRMTNLCAALGCAQLEYLPTILDYKRIILLNYKEQLLGLPLIFQNDFEFTSSSAWMVSILCSSPSLRDNLRSYLKEKSVETRPLFPPVHHMPMYSDIQYSLPISDSISSLGLNLPSYPSLSKIDIATISSYIREFFA